MKNIFSFILAVSLIGTQALATPQGFTGFEKGQSSASFFAGQPVFFRYNKFISWNKAWSVDGGYHFDKYPYLAGNYTVYFYNVKDRLKREQSFFNSLLFYAGPGVFFGPDFGEAKSDEKVKIGVRIFGGVEYIFRESPWSVSAEIGTALFIEGDDFVGFQGMLGITRYIGGIKKRKIKSKTTIIEDNTNEMPVSLDEEGNMKGEAKPKKAKLKKGAKVKASPQEQGNVEEFEEFE